MTSRAAAVFTQGSLARHVLVMTATGSVGLVAIFAVDLLSLLYISWSGNAALTAAVGMASQVLFFGISINIGLTIAVSALVARAIGAHDRPRAQRLAASGIVHSFILSTVIGIALFVWQRDFLSLLGARDGVMEGAVIYLNWTLPTNGLMAVGMVFSGILRSVGDARRSMYVTLFGAITTAILDPVLILWLDMGIFGAAIASNVARLAWIVVGYWGAVHIHGIVTRPRREALFNDLKPVMQIALPAILTNLAAPVSTSYSVRALANFGEAAMAAGAIIDRVTPAAFVAVYAMSGAVGPIIGQNFGAKQYERVRGTLTTSFTFGITYSLVVWLLLYLAAPGIVLLFNASGQTAQLVLFFCSWGAVAWVFLGCLFAANAAFNNLDYAFLSTLFNWGRATLGTIPFVALGAHFYGPEGVFLGLVAGSGLFCVAAIISAYRIAGRIARRSQSVTSEN
jgi:putative MATE family efflux protein